MNKKRFIGMGLCLLCTLIGGSIFTLVFAEGPFIESLFLLYTEKKLGALISLGALLNLPVFFYLLRQHKFSIAYGMIGMLLFLVAVVAFLKVH